MRVIEVARDATAALTENTEKGSRQFLIWISHSCIAGTNLEKETRESKGSFRTKNRTLAYNEYTVNNPQPYLRTPGNVRSFIICSAIVCSFVGAKQINNHQVDDTRLQRVHCKQPATLPTNTRERW